ncbi:MAG: four helix bundle protein [Bacteroidota bacterium]|nr:four helix bundle protein [Bacteroidota bacterium]
MIYRKLEVYKQSIEFVAEIYNLTHSFPKSELFGITSQIRRAAVSIPLNIAEGSAKSSQKDYARFLQIALGSATEIEAIFDIIIRINYLQKNQISDCSFALFKIRKMLQSMINQRK